MEWSNGGGMYGVGKGGNNANIDGYWDHSYGGGWLDDDTGDKGSNDKDSKVNKSNTTLAGNQGAVGNSYGVAVTSYTDKEDASRGLSKETTDGKPTITVRDNQIIVNTNDMVAEQSLSDAQAWATLNGIRSAASGLVTGATNTFPITITYTTSSATPSGIQENDPITIAGVVGNTAANGLFRAANVTPTTFELKWSSGNGTYHGSGNWFRPADASYPQYADTDSVITGNHMKIRFNTVLKVVKSVTCTNVSMPRDIIPIESYIPDILSKSLYFNDPTNPFVNVANFNFQTYIFQNRDLLVSQLYGFFSTPLSVFRTYYGAFALPDKGTPLPIALWFPPYGNWPLQPQPYPLQTVPTYVSNTITTPSSTTLKGTITCSGYGVYDLKDWTSSTGVPAVDRILSDVARKKLLMSIVAPQSQTINNDTYYYITLIMFSNTTGTNTTPFGYGDYQRFLPGPGLGMNYQPGTSDGANPNVTGVGWSVPFPLFRGNTWGPFDTPGDRFQKVGLKSLIEDYYLNGDLTNPNGNPIINPTIATSLLMISPSYGINYSIDDVTWDTLQFVTNLNILNGGRIMSNGFGVVNEIVLASNSVYIDRYQQGGTQGPSFTSEPWVDNGIDGNPNGNLSYPIAAGSESGVPTPANSSASVTNANIGYRDAYNDTGVNNGQFVKWMFNFQNFLISEIPDTSIVLKISEADRVLRSQCTNSVNATAILNLPIRLSAGSTTGTEKYEESLWGCLSDSSYWKFKYIIPRGKLAEFNISFFTYEGLPIPIERLLEPRSSLLLLEKLQDMSVAVPFDPYNKFLVGRVKRTMQLFFRIETYEYENIGLMDNIRNLLERGSDRRG